jgi:hypothetical protein
MKRNLFFAFALFAFFTFLSACDKIDAPYLDLKETHVDTGQNNDTTYKRVILLEDFTGHKCVNCPEAAVLAKNLQLANPGRIVVVAIHEGFFATPDATGKYTADYRCTEGNTLNSHYGIISNPTGLVNRKTFGGKIRLTADKWEAAITQELAMEPQAHIEIKNNYNVATRELSIQTRTTFLQNLGGNYNISLYITEDAIVSPQKNNNSSVGPTPDILDYAHSHVLRTAVNNVWGESLNGSPGVSKDQVFSKTHTITLSQLWNADACSVVAIITRTDVSEDKYQVLQAAEKHVK